MLNGFFRDLPKGSFVDLILETSEVCHAVMACADIISMKLDQQVFCQLEDWRKLMNTWRIQGTEMRVGRFEEEGLDVDCLRYRMPAIHQARQAEQDDNEEREHPTACLA
jgi:hypothetical protein